VEARAFIVVVELAVVVVVNEYIGCPRLISWLVCVCAHVSVCVRACVCACVRACVVAESCLLGYLFPYSFASTVTLTHSHTPYCIYAYVCMHSYAFAHIRLCMYAYMRVCMQIRA
jgi:hypothetical protein